MPFILPLATVLTAALTFKTLKGTAETIIKRNKRKKRNEN